MKGVKGVNEGDEWVKGLKEIKKGLMGDGGKGVEGVKGLKEIKKGLMGHGGKGVEGVKEVKGGH